MTDEQVVLARQLQIAEATFRHAVRAAWEGDLTTGQICSVGKIGPKRVRDYCEGLPDRRQTVKGKGRSGVRIPDEVRAQMMAVIREDTRPQYVVAEMFGVTAATVIRIIAEERGKPGNDFVPTWGKATKKNRKAST